ncbi:DNA repair ATPase [Tepidimicrobium xylanilyticum]|uniref:AAA domain-containing protein n=1 Tax=Tepidimicrobium xylanilyticum TaxID=1123352 RepID=A0A1H3DYK9_9FIRM|nr:DNA repair ATPase [Tepidimicrobium xylanilyticum]SDX71562.1 AAA domain-containing protein [Tepidimicrobium xylanilyticum]
MILKELNLISFGKFENKIFKLEEGLNIIYGENESGKTTIHNFIYGMFYGFLRPYAKKRYYLEEYERYKPWSRNEYMGILKLVKNGKEYRIERDFHKGELKVYDELTGEDITSKIDNGEKVKLHLPGVHFFDFNSIVYKNTISVSQLGNRVDLDLSKEVKDRLANISTSLDDEVSVKEAVAYLEDELKKIGTGKAYTKPYGKVLIQLEKLREKRKLVMEKQKEYNNTVDEINIIRKRIEHEEEELLGLKDLLVKAELLEKKRFYDEILDLQEQIKSLDKNIELLKPYSFLNLEDYTTGLKFAKDLEILDNQIESLRSKIDGLELRIKKDVLKEDGQIIKDIKVDELTEDVNSFNEMEDERNDLVLNSQQNRLEILNGEAKNLEERIKGLKIKGYAFLLFGAIALGLVLVNPLIGILLLAFTGLFIATRKTISKYSYELDKLMNNIKIIGVEEEKRKNRLYAIDEKQKGILHKYSCSSKVELNQLYEKVRLMQIKYSQDLEYINRLKSELEEAKNLLERKSGDRQYIKERLDEILYKNKSNTLEEFKEGLDKNKDYERLLLDREGKVEAIKRILGDTTLEELESILSEFDEDYFNIDKLDISHVKNQIKLKEESLSTLKSTWARLEGRINSLNDEIKYLADIEGEINRLEAEAKYYKDRINSIEIAKRTIEKISREIHNQFAPEINRQVSRIINLISKGKYGRVKVRDDLNMAVENPSTGEIIPIDSLSGGTVDQLYFALRFSITTSIKGASLPLILDDCFIQYDNHRLGNILKFIAEISKERQIILFTCHYREKQILDKLGLEYNFISLS